MMLIQRLRVPWCRPPAGRMMPISSLIGSRAVRPPGE
jgi:hypothetical protein